MSTVDFYKNVSPMKDMYELISSDTFINVPSDWDIVVTDIFKSTEAIEKGRYKDINFISASVIIALLNALPNIHIPFVFGGDGTTLAIPNIYREKVTDVLVDIRSIVQNRFGLTLRTGIVPVEDLNKMNGNILLAKHAISKNYEQAIFKGGGISLAEELVKSADSVYNVDAPLKEGCADFSGLECRWEDIYSFKGESMSLIIKIRDKNETEVYRSVLKEIDNLYGPAGKRNPIGEQDLKLTFKKRSASFEAKVLRKSEWAHTLKVWFINLLAIYLYKFGNDDWLKYKKLVKSTCDYEKFDDSLKLVLSGTPFQRQQLFKILDTYEKSGKIVYGSLVTDRALITCLIFERHGRQVHFIDAADGGYALAAKQLKEKMAKLSS